MARLWTSGHELGHAVASGLTISGSAAAATDQKRTGTYSLKIPAAATTSYGLRSFTGVAAVDYFARSYVRMSALPAGASIALLAEYQAGSAAVYAEVVATSTGALRVDTSAGVAGTSAAGVVAAGSFQLVEFRVKVQSAGLDEFEVRVNGAQVLNVTLAWTTNAPTAVGFGQDTASASGVDVWHDDMCLNDSTGVSQNSWPGVGAVRKLIPAGTNTVGTGWQKPGGATTNLHTSVDNVPPNGVTDTTLATAAENQVRNATSTTTGDLRINLQSYDAGSVPASDAITLVQPLAVTGASSATTPPSGSLELVSNPVIAEVSFGSFRAAANAGTFPTGWITRYGTVAYAPSVARATQPVIELGKRTATTTAGDACALALLVESAPGSVVPTPRVSPVLPGPAVDRAGMR